MSHVGRIAIASRVLAATLGAYFVTSLFAIDVSLLLVWLGRGRVEAVYTAYIVSFAVFATISLVVFHARSIRLSWMWLIGAAVPLGLAVWLHGA